MAPRSEAVNAVVDLFDLVERFVSKPLFRDRQARIAGVDLPRSAVTLLLELERAGPVTMSALASRIGLDQSTITRQIAPLVASGLVLREAWPANRRHIVVELSDEGREVRERLRNAWVSDVERVLDQWSPRDQASLAGSIRAFCDCLREDTRDRLLTSRIPA